MPAHGLHFPERTCGQRGESEYTEPGFLDCSTPADFPVSIARCASELLCDCRRYRSNSAAIDFFRLGPVVITTGFIAYLVAAAAGAAMAAIAVLVPPYLIVIASAPHYRTFARKLASEGVHSGRGGGSDCGSCVHSWQAFVN